MTSSTLWSSPPTVTGCALPPPPASRSGIWSPSPSLMSSSPSSPTSERSLTLPRLSPWPGPLMVRPSSLVTLTPSSVSGPLVSKYSHKETLLNKNELSTSSIMAVLVKIICFCCLCLSMVIEKNNILW